MLNSYPIGAEVNMSASFVVSGVATDPTTVQAKIRQPNGTITTYTYGTDASLVRDNIGVYHVTVIVSGAGVWSYRFIGTGVCAAAYEAEFFVQPSDFGASG